MSFFSRPPPLYLPRMPGSTLFFLENGGGRHERRRHALPCRRPRAQCNIHQRDEPITPAPAHSSLAAAFYERAPLGEQVRVRSTGQLFEPFWKLPFTETLAPLALASPPL